MKNTTQCIRKHAKWLHTVLLTASLLVQTATTQTTAFTYQGKLTDAGNPANGNYDLQFRLFDALLSGNQVGSTVVREDVTVSSGIFSATLDFGAAAFPGGNRWLEISVRPGVSTGAFTTLAPLQPITATPYAIQTLNAHQLDGVPASSYTKLNASGNLGLGISAPAHRLTIGGGPGWTTHNWGGAIGLENTAALGWSPNTSGQGFGLGQTNTGLAMFRTTSQLGTTTNPPTYDFRIDNGGNVGIGADLNTSLTGARLHVFGGDSMGITSVSNINHGVNGESTGLGAAGVLGKSTHPIGFGVYGRNLNGGLAMYADGPVGQARDKGGWVKAMLYVNENGTIARCYNSFLTGSAASTSPCGFNVNYDSGYYGIDFGFPVQDRFWTVTPTTVPLRERISLTVYMPLFPSPNRLIINTFSTTFNSDASGSFCVVIF